MKRIGILILAVCLLLAGCGASERRIQGEAWEIRNDGETLSFLVDTDDGEQIRVQAGAETGIISWIDAVTAEDLRNGRMEGIMVTVSGAVSKGTLMAENIQISGLLTRGGVTLADGTALDVVAYDSYTMYQLPDGTQLLMDTLLFGPENVSVVGVDSLDDLNDAAREKILAYYEEQGVLYDVNEKLEKAYEQYRLLGAESVSVGVAGQDIAPAGANEQIICFLTCVVTPDTGRYQSTELRLGAVFDRETGKHLSGYDLFTCEPGEIIEKLAQIGDIQDQDLIGEMKANFKPEYVVLFPECLEINFPYGSLPEYDTGFGMAFDYNEEIRALLQPWAIPDSEEAGT